jgi:hypothetical protein
MRKAQSAKTTGAGARGGAAEDLRTEYRFDYSKAKPNRFAGAAGKGSLVVVLDDDIADVFRTPESVKAVLRALIRSMPRPPRPRTCRHATAG